MSTAGYVKLLLPPRQSRGNSHWGLGHLWIRPPGVAQDAEAAEPLAGYALFPAPEDLVQQLRRGAGRRGRGRELPPGRHRHYKAVLTNGTGEQHPPNAGPPHHPPESPRTRRARPCCASKTGDEEKECVFYDLATLPLSLLVRACRHESRSDFSGDRRRSQNNAAARTIEL